VKMISAVTDAFPHTDMLGTRIFQDRRLARSFSRIIIAFKASALDQDVTGFVDQPELADHDSTRQCRLIDFRSKKAIYFKDMKFTVAGDRGNSRQPSAS